MLDKERFSKDFLITASACVCTCVRAWVGLHANKRSYFEGKFKDKLARNMTVKRWTKLHQFVNRQWWNLYVMSHVACDLCQIWNSCECLVEILKLNLRTFKCCYLYRFNKKFTNSSLDGCAISNDVPCAPFFSFIILSSYILHMEKRDFTNYSHARNVEEMLEQTTKQNYSC